MSHHQPTDQQIRQRILEIDDEHYRLAFMYQLLICGRISEICGKYAPRGTDVIKTSFEVETKTVKEINGEQYTEERFQIKKTLSHNRFHFVEL